MNPSDPPPPPYQPSSASSGPSPTIAILLLLLPCLGCMALIFLNRTVFGNGDALIVPILGTFLVGPWIVGIIAARRIAQSFNLGTGARVLMAVGFIAASFALCIPGCASAQ